MNLKDTANIKNNWLFEHYVLVDLGVGIFC